MVERFIIGELYSHEEVYRSLGVGNAGGVRFVNDENGLTKRGVLFTSVPSGRILSENPYHDRIEGDVLVYTAQGRKGEQGFGGQNQRLLSHDRERYPLYCFQLIASRRDKTVGVKRWRFIGLLYSLRRYKEQQVDVLGTIRTVCIFEFSILSNFPYISVERDEELARPLYSAFVRDCNKQDGDVVLVNEDLDQASRWSPEELEKTRFEMLSLHPAAFERLIKTTLEVSGYHNVCTTKYSQDGGIDVEAYAGRNLWPITDLHLQVQAKRWMHTVGRKEVAELRGSLAMYARGAIVTTSQFSKAAIFEAHEAGKLPIVMIDGYDFAKIVLDYNVPLQQHQCLE